MEALMPKRKEAKVALHLDRFAEERLTCEEVLNFLKERPCDGGALANRLADVAFDLMPPVSLPIVISCGGELCILPGLGRLPARKALRILRQLLAAVLITLPERVEVLLVCRKTAAGKPVGRPYLIPAQNFVDDYQLPLSVPFPVLRIWEDLLRPVNGVKLPQSVLKAQCKYADPVHDDKQAST
jgi:hypothetical protein